MPVTVVSRTAWKSSALKGKSATLTSSDIFETTKGYTSEFPSKWDDLQLSSLSSPYFRQFSTEFLQTNWYGTYIYYYKIFVCVSVQLPQELTWNLTDQNFYFATNCHICHRYDSLYILLVFKQNIKKNKMGVEKHSFKVSGVATTFTEIQ